MRAGRLRHRFQLQSPTETRSESGAVVQSWATYKRVWGQLEPVEGREYVESDKLKAQTTHFGHIRHHAGLQANHRIIARGRTFQIENVQTVDERDREMLLQLREQVT